MRWPAGPESIHRIRKLRKESPKEITSEVKMEQGKSEETRFKRYSIDGQQTSWLVEEFYLKALIAEEDAMDKGSCSQGLEDHKRKHDSEIEEDDDKDKALHLRIKPGEVSKRNKTRICRFWVQLSLLQR
ncbi:hypothetical protein Tco_0971525 [Tanacetum coccineum]